MSETILLQPGSNVASTANRPDEWKIEQGLSGAVLPVLDMTGPTTKSFLPQTFGPLTKDETAIKAVGDRTKLFRADRKGWKGYQTEKSSSSPGQAQGFGPPTTDG